jgi:hypothetical protein
MMLSYAKCSGSKTGNRNPVKSYGLATPEN